MTPNRLRKLKPASELDFGVPAEILESDPDLSNAISAIRECHDQGRDTRPLLEELRIAYNDIYKTEVKLETVEHVPDTGSAEEAPFGSASQPRPFGAAKGNAYPEPLVAAANISEIPSYTVVPGISL